jgi:hypothetical protein
VPPAKEPLQQVPGSPKPKQEQVLHKQAFKRPLVERARQRPLFLLPPLTDAGPDWWHLFAALF